MDVKMFKYILIFMILLAWTHGCIYLGLDEEEEKGLQERLLEKRRRRIEEHEKERLRTEVRKIREDLDKHMTAQYKVYEKLRKRKAKLEEDRKYMREKTSSMSTQNSHADVDRDNFLRLHKENENKIRFLGAKLEKLHAQAKELDGELLKDAHAMERLLETLKATGERCEGVEKDKEETRIALEEMALVLARPVETRNETKLIGEGRGEFAEDSIEFLDVTGEKWGEFNGSKSALLEDSVDPVDDLEESVDEPMSCGSPFSLSDDDTTTISTFPGKCSRDPPTSTCSSKLPLRDRSLSCPSRPRVSSD